MDDKMIAFLRLMHYAFYAARDAHDYSFDNTEKHRKEDKCTAIVYAAVCVARYSSAQAIYWVTPDLEHGEIPELFAAFDKFTHEVLSDYATNHSRQWVDIYFEELKEKYENSVCSQRIVE